ncbi:hypothetical protein PISMIDRAFT_689015 [Pisolithus microcarpus 441]|uniref:Uncharacterized protein n=1 Tax=Pisolithus microcarpus 441 TaxID=765257 RepID=A0A0C9XL78_9AGAM|nr:hypothetical protein PISMIDRAFT_689015 [Pisolithus microcarpus 441]
MGTSKDTFMVMETFGDGLGYARIRVSTRSFLRRDSRGKDHRWNIDEDTGRRLCY